MTIRHLQKQTFLNDRLWKVETGCLNLATKAVQGLVAGRENEGVIKFIDTKIEYKVPKPKQ